MQLAIAIIQVIKAADVLKPATDAVGALAAGVDIEDDQSRELFSLCAAAHDALANAVRSVEAAEMALSAASLLARASKEIPT